MTVQIRVFQHSFAIIAANVEMSLEDDAILRQRACLVGAQDIHRAKILNRVQALHDDALLRHGDRALGEIDSDDHRQHFWRQSNCDSHVKRLMPLSKLVSSRLPAIESASCPK